MSKQSCITKFVVCSSASTVPSVQVATVILKIVKGTGAGTRKVTGRRENKGEKKREKKLFYSVTVMKWSGRTGHRQRSQ